MMHDPACETYRLRETVRARLGVFRQWMADRDELVRDALAAGLSKQEIHQMSGLARATIDAILRGHGRGDAT